MNRTVSPSEMYRYIGGRIRIARKRMSLTQEQLAQSVSMTRTSISNIEKGRQNLLVHKLIEFADALRILPADLLPPVPDDRSDSVEELVSHESEDAKEFVRNTMQPISARSKPREHRKTEDTPAD